MQYEHLFFLIIGAVFGYVVGYYIQYTKIKIMESKIDTLENEYKKLLEITTN